MEFNVGFNIGGKFETFLLKEKGVFFCEL